MIVKGIKRGQAIELQQKLDIPDGQEVLIEIPDIPTQTTHDFEQNISPSNDAEDNNDDLNKVFAEMQLEKDAEQTWRQKYWKHPKKALNKAERKAKLDSVIQSWKGDTELLEIFSEIEQERHADLGRADVSFDS